MPTRQISVLQDRLQAAVRGLLDDWLGPEQPLVVGAEGKPWRSWRGRADLWVARPDNEKHVAVIEIEGTSEASQGSTNVLHPVHWIAEDTSRRCTVLHVVNEGSRLGEPRVSAAARVGFDARVAFSAQFQYDMICFDASEFVRGSTHARNISENATFRLLLWQHLRFLAFTEGVPRYLPLPHARRFRGTRTHVSASYAPIIQVPPRK